MSKHDVLVILVVHLLVLLGSLESLLRRFLGGKVHGIYELTDGSDGNAVFSLDCADPGRL